MHTKIARYPVLPALLAVALLALATMACACQPILLGEVSQDVEVSLDEELFQDSQPSFQFHGHDFWDDLDVDVTRMTLEDGYIRFYGTRHMPDGSMADCTIDLRLTAEQGALVGRIIALDVPGLTLEDPLVVAVNDDLQAVVQLAEFRAASELRFEEVEVSEGVLRIKVHLDMRF